MKRIKLIQAQRVIIILMLLLISMSSLANDYYDINFDGINYRLLFRSYDSHGIPSYVTAEVRKLESGHYSGFVSIPPSVTWTQTWAVIEGNTYQEITTTYICPVTAIGGAFKDCSGLTGVSIPNSVLEIGSGSFKNCTNLTSIVIPNSVTTLAYEAFSGCSGLKNLTIGNSVVTIGNAVFANCISLTDVNIPNSVESIGGGAFSRCSGLSNLILGESLKNIYSSAFSDCSSLSSVTIPSSVEFIGTYVFAGCNNLTSVTCLPETPPSGADGYTFRNLYDQITLHVPAGSLYEYQTTWPWWQFYRILPIEQDYTVTLDETNIVMEKGDEYHLKATVSPDDDQAPSVTWSTSNSNVATVNDMGFVTAVGSGECTITARAGEASATCRVKVVDHIVTLDQSSANIPLFSTLQLHATVTPHDGYEPPVTWSSNWPGVASVSSDGLVMGRTTGTAVITATAGHSTATCVVTVEPILATSLVLNTYQKQMYVGQNFSLVATVFPETASNRSVSWSIPENDVIAYSLSGNVCQIYAKKVGSVTITAHTTDGSNLSKSCVVTVTESGGVVILAQSITLDKHSMTMDKGTIQKLTATILPTNTTNKNVRWTSNNARVATVDADGHVRAYQSGTAIITASTTDGSNLSDQCVVTVVAAGPNVVLADSIILDKHEMTITEDAICQLTATIIPDNASNKVVLWSSSDTTVATVDAFGFVSGIKAGSATITASTTDGTNLSDNCALTVVEGGLEPLLPGDLDGDGRVSVGDLATLIDFLLYGDDLGAGDVNGDGAVNVADLADIIDILLSH